MKTFLLTFVTISAATSLAFTGATAAQAITWPTNGWIQMPGASGGGAIWSMDEYGIRQSWPAVNNSMAVGLSFPNEFYSANNEYLYCGNTDGSDSTVTQLENGDVSVDCAPSVDTLSPGLTVTMHFRFYAEAPSGYLARQWAEIHNTSGTTVDLSATPIYVGSVFNTLAWDSATSYFTASDGTTGTTNFADGQVWGVNGDSRGNFIATSSAWGSSCQARDFTVTYQLYTLPSSADVISAGETVNLISFMNMVFPATNDAAGATAAYDTALAQAHAEYDLGLTGRLAEGLEPGLNVVGWCSPVAPDTESVTLPNTGRNNAGIASAGSLGIVLFAFGALVLLRMRAHRRSSASSANQTESD